MKKVTSFITASVVSSKTSQMKRKSVAMGLIALCMLFSNLALAQVRNTLTRTQYNIATGAPGYTTTPVVIKLSSSGTFSTSATQTFNVGSSYTFLTNQTKIDVSMEGGAFTSALTTPGSAAAPFYLPTVLNAETEIKMINYSYQYGYGVFIKCVGTNQYEISVLKYDCLNCPPPGGGSN